MRLRPTALGRARFFCEGDKSDRHETDYGGPHIDPRAQVLGAGRQGDGVEDRSCEGCEHWGFAQMVYTCPGQGVQSGRQSGKLW